MKKSLSLTFLVFLFFLVLSSQVSVAAACKHSAKNLCYVEELAWGGMNSWSDLDGDWAKDSREPRGSCVLVAASFLGGRVVAVGDEGFLSNVLVDEADNWKLSANIIAWLTEYEESDYRILFDSAHNELENINSEDPWLGFSKLAGKLRAEGYTVDDNVDQITWRTLRDCDVLVVNAPNRRFLPSEIAAIVTFVLKGGGLFLMGEWQLSQHQGVAEILNPLAANFGIRFNEDTVCDPDDYWISDPRYPIIYVFANHPIFTDINEIYYYIGCSVERR